MKSLGSFPYQQGHLSCIISQRISRHPYEWRWLYMKQNDRKNSLVLICTQ